MSLKDKVSIITGGGQGIGKRIAQRLAAQGALVIINDIRRETGSRAAKEIEASYGVKAVFRRGDVKKRDEVYNLIEFAVTNFGRIDLLVNNAGILFQTRLEEISEEEWDEVLNTNLRGVFFCCQAVTPIMKKQGQGKILNMASSAGKIGGMVAGAHYSASKAGVICITKVFAKELAPFGVTVNAVAPGFVNTDMIHDFPPESIENYKKNCPLGSLAETDDIAEAAMYLLSERAKHITGEILDINGGTLMD